MEKTRKIMFVAMLSMLVLAVYGCAATDTIPPVITLLGEAEVTIGAGTAYVDAGATAWDNYDGNITADIVVTNHVNTAVVGIYHVIFNVTDTHGNKAVKVVRVVHVVDTTPPVITLLGEPEITIEVGAVYVDAGATAWDNLDGDITADIVATNPVNTAVVGTYIVRYNVVDANGNYAVEVARTVRVARIIQEAIDAANDGAEIIIPEGVYPENINFGGKNIVLRSTDPTNPDVVANTIIDGTNSGPVVTFSGTETSDCVLSGFTIRNGKAEIGGGIIGNYAEATIENNVITSNSADYSGGGLGYCIGTIRNNTVNNNSSQLYGGGFYYCDGTIENNIITSNSADAYGGGLGYCYGTIQNNIITSNSAGGGGGLVLCNGTIQNNIISKNHGGSAGGLGDCYGTIQNNIITENSSIYGAGLFRCGWEDGGIWNNTIVNNSATREGGGLYLCGNIENNIVWSNSAPNGAQLNDSCSMPTYCCIQDWTGGGEGNISSDPNFGDPANGDFHLKPDSACIDAGCPIDGVTEDFEGDSRPFGSGFDIGADESTY